MALAGIIVISTFVAVIINKGLKGIERKQFKGYFLIFVGFALQLIIFNEKFANSKYNYLMPYIYILSLLILLSVLLLNLKYHGIKIAFIGFLLNSITIIANGGYMPQDISKLELVGNLEKAELLRELGHFYNGVMMTKDTRLNFLGDIIAIPKPQILASVYSIGDVFITIGLIIFVFELLKRSNYTEEVDYDYL